jgi:RNA polymerase sigma-70 factor (ECF subfamily)
MTKTSAQMDCRGSFSNNSAEDQEIAKRIKLRDPNAMADLYDKYGGLVYSVTLRCVRNRATAEDLVQLTFLHAWGRMHTFDSVRGHLKSWLLAIARNRSIDHLRSSRHQRMAATVPLEDLERFGLPLDQETELDRLGQRRWANDAFGLLNSDQRLVLELTYFQGFTQTEIAQRLSKPLGTVKSLVRSALKVIRARADDGDIVMLGVRR